MSLAEILDQGGGNRIVGRVVAGQGRFQAGRHRLAALDAPLVERVQAPELSGKIGPVLIKCDEAAEGFGAEGFVVQE